MPITLTTAQTEIIQRNNVTVETHDTAAVTQVTTDLVTNVMVFLITYGTPASNAFAPGPRPGPQTAPITVTVNLGTGAWQSSNGLSGTITAALSTINTNTKNLRNVLETVTNAQSIVTGTVVAWT